MGTRRGFLPFKLAHRSCWSHRIQGTAFHLQWCCCSSHSPRVERFIVPKVCSTTKARNSIHSLNLNGSRVLHLAYSWKILYGWIFFFGQVIFHSTPREKWSSAFYFVVFFLLLRKERWWRLFAQFFHSHNPQLPNFQNSILTGTPIFKSRTPKIVLNIYQN